MPDRLLSPRDVIAWACGFVVVAAALVAIGFTSTDPDSALYAGLADRLAHEPVHRWLAPEWWGFWPDAQMIGFFREHPAGVLLLPAALSKAGIPPLQGSYVVGIAAGLASLILMATLIRRFATRDEARAALVLLQLMPVAFIFRIRANHEYPMLVCLLVALHGLVWASRGRRPWIGVLLVSFGLVAGLFVKGVFVLKILLAIGVWIALNPLRLAGARRRSLVAGLLGTGLMIAGAAAYDAAYLSATGERFWALYWQRQMSPLGDVSGGAFVLAMIRNLLFYLSRMLWHPAPWSVALLVAAWRMRGSSRARWLEISESSREGLRFALTFAALAILLLVPASRFAERYAFSATHAVACISVVAACRVWPRLAARLAAADRHIPAAPALVWLALALLRLAVGSVR